MGPSENQTHAPERGRRRLQSMALSPETFQNIWFPNSNPVGRVPMGSPCLTGSCYAVSHLPLTKNQLHSQTASEGALLGPGTDRRASDTACPQGAPISQEERQASRRSQLSVTSTATRASTTTVPTHDGHSVSSLLSLRCPVTDSTPRRAVLTFKALRSRCARHRSLRAHNLGGRGGRGKQKSS